MKRSLRYTGVLYRLNTMWSPLMEQQSSDHISMYSRITLRYRDQPEMHLFLYILLKLQHL